MTEVSHATLAKVTARDKVGALIESHFNVKV